MRARYPDQEGTVVRDGIEIHYDVYGDDGPTVLLLPTWSFTHARQWKLQIPYLARHYRVVCFDGRGNGRSDRPAEPSAYTVEHFTADAVAVLDATATERAVVLSVSRGALWALRLCAEHPERVISSVFIGPAARLVPTVEERLLERFDSVIENPTGWQRHNAHHWRTQYPDFVDFFARKVLTEPHSTKPIEDAVAWALETDGETLVATERALNDVDRAMVTALAAKVSCPVLVIHGEADKVRPLGDGEALAELTGGSLVTVTNGGHWPHGRDPVLVNRLIREFVDRTTGAPMPGRVVRRRGHGRPRRVLYLSSPIGLGHARRDVAVAKELKRRRPEIELDWLAQYPVTAVLEAEGERVHPASRWLANESAHITSEADDHDLHCFQALRRMDEILLANFMLFQEVIDDDQYDVVVGDEAWEVDHFWHENPELKRGQHVWLTDFVGFLPMPDGGTHEAYLTTDYNAEMIEHIDRYPWIRDRSIFVGNADDIVPDTFGDDLPAIRDWTSDHFSYSGYITGFAPPSADDVGAARHELGFREGEPVCVVAVGGSGVGKALLDRVIDAFPLAARDVPGLRMVVVAGPSIDPAVFPRRPGLEVRGYVDRLYRHLGACDLALVQGGLTTTMELTAAKRPFLYFPLGHHFEQQFHVRHRLDRYGAGRCMDLATSDADALAAAIVESIGRPVTYRDVESDGAVRAAELIAELL